MNERHTWRQAEEAVQWLQFREAARRTLLLLAHLPLLPENIIERLAGLRGGASLYRCLEELREARLVAALRLPFRPGHPPQLLYLTDLGLATIALDQGVEPEHLARRNRLRRVDLLALLPGLPQLVALYDLLAALAASQPGRPNLLAWERPWRRRYLRPTAKAPVGITLPAYAAVAWQDEAGAYLLLPDLGGLPLHVYRPVLDHLLVLRGLVPADFPTLVVATADQSRVEAWKDLLEQARRVRTEQPLEACVATWDNLDRGLQPLGTIRSKDAGLHDHLIHRVRLQGLRRRRSAGVLRELVGVGLDATVSAGTTALLGETALGVSAVDRRLLDLVGRHPFLPTKHLATVLSRQLRWTRRRRDQLITRGLMRLVEECEVSAEAAPLELVELTAEGLALAAAQQGLSVAAGVRILGLAGGGPHQPTGARRKLRANLAHTLGADSTFVSLVSTATKFREAGSQDALVEWRNAAASSRRHVRPDGYGLYRHAGQLYGFFLEYDRGTMGIQDYLEKFAAYYEFLGTRSFERDYEGFPTILVVTIDNATEERIGRAARVAAVGRGVKLPLLLTCQWRIDHDRNPHGLLGPIWREPDEAFGVRRYWQVQPISMAERRPAHRDGATADVARA